jgi:hypothetical protein
MLAPLVLLTLAACATTGEPQVREGEGTCDLVKGQRFEGQTATAELGHDLLLATGARTLRWVPPRTAVTMDYRPDRLTVSYDDAMVITKVSCT